MPNTGTPILKGEARLTYLDGEFLVEMPGMYVTCAITGAKIDLEDLRYWSVDRQEAYRDSAASVQAWQQADRLS